MPYVKLDIQVRVGGAYVSIKYTFLTSETYPGVIGIEYILSAIPLEVCTVAMLGLTRIVCMPSSLKALSA